MPTTRSDSGYAYSNAILGIVDSYSESNRRPYQHGRQSDVEWYVQDSWKATRRLTIEAGIRFYRTHLHLADSDLKYSYSFDPAVYSAAQQPPLIQPYINPANNQRVGRDPITGALLPAIDIGSFSSAAGKPYQGMIGNEKGLNVTPIEPAPRVAWRGTFSAMARPPSVPALASSTTRWGQPRFLRWRVSRPD